MTQSIGSFARNIIATRNELSNAQVLELVKVQFPNAKTSIACIAWYKSNMKKTGFKVEAVVTERTLEVIQAEIAAKRDELEMLEEELKIKQEETEDFEQAQLDALLAKRGLKAVAA